MPTSGVSPVPTSRVRSRSVPKSPTAHQSHVMTFTTSVTSRIRPTAAAATSSHERDRVVAVVDARAGASDGARPEVRRARRPRSGRRRIAARRSASSPPGSSAGPSMPPAAPGRDVVGRHGQTLPLAPCDHGPAGRSAHEVQRRADRSVPSPRLIVASWRSLRLRNHDVRTSPRDRPPTVVAKRLEAAMSAVASPGRDRGALDRGARRRGHPRPVPCAGARGRREGLRAG